MHGNEEHLLREGRRALRIRQVPHLGARFLVKLSHDHDLLHFAIRQRPIFVFVEIVEELRVLLFVFGSQVPH